MAMDGACFVNCAEGALVALDHIVSIEKVQKPEGFSRVTTVTGKSFLYDGWPQDLVDAVRESY